MSTSAALAFPLPLARPRAMTRCECARVSFDQVARRVEDGLSLREACQQTRCGQTCGACLPDLQAYLATRPRQLQGATEGAAVAGP